MRNVFQRCTNRAALIVPFAALLCSPFQASAGTILGSAASFAVLGAAGVTNTGATLIYGNVGVTPAALVALTGFPPAIITGGTALGPASAADQALLDINTAAITLAGLAMTGDLTGQDLGTIGPLIPGIYSYTSNAQLTGTLTLNATGNPNALFVFRIGSELTTASSSVVNVIGGNSNTAVYWVVGSQATLGSSSTFAGNILAGTSIALDSTAKIECGRAFARTGSVTLIDNLISGNCAAANFDSNRSDFDSLGFSGGGVAAQVVPELGTFTLLGLGAGLLLLGKFRSNR